MTDKPLDTYEEQEESLRQSALRMEKQIEQQGSQETVFRKPVSIFAGFRMRKNLSVPVKDVAALFGENLSSEAKNKYEFPAVLSAFKNSFLSRCSKDGELTKPPSTYDELKNQG